MRKSLEEMTEKLRDVHMAFRDLQSLFQEFLSPGGVPHKIEQLSVTITELSRRVTDFTNLVGRAHFPAEEMGLLAAELRAIRYLLDPAGEFRSIDKLHDAYARAKEKRASIPVDSGSGGTHGTESIGPTQP